MGCRPTRIGRASFLAHDGRHLDCRQQSSPLRHGGELPCVAQCDPHREALCALRELHHSPGRGGSDVEVSRQSAARYGVRLIFDWLVRFGIGRVVFGTVYGQAASQYVAITRRARIHRSTGWLCRNPAVTCVIYGDVWLFSISRHAAHPSPDSDDHFLFSITNDTRIVDGRIAHSC
jgi:hypothetical protein